MHHVGRISGARRSKGARKGQHRMSTWKWIGLPRSRRGRPWCRPLEPRCRMRRRTVRGPGRRAEFMSQLPNGCAPSGSPPPKPRPSVYCWATLPGIVGVGAICGDDDPDVQRRGTPHGVEVMNVAVADDSGRVAGVIRKIPIEPVYPLRSVAPRVAALLDVKHERHAGMQAPVGFDHGSDGVGVVLPVRTAVGVHNPEYKLARVQRAAHPCVVGREMVVAVCPIADTDRQDLIQVAVVDDGLELGDIREQSVYSRFTNCIRRSNATGCGVLSRTGGVRDIAIALSPKSLSGGAVLLLPRACLPRPTAGSRFTIFVHP